MVVLAIFSSGQAATQFAAVSATDEPSVASPRVVPASAARSGIRAIAVRDASGAFTTLTVVGPGSAPAAVAVPIDTYLSVPGVFSGSVAELGRAGDDLALIVLTDVLGIDIDAVVAGAPPAPTDGLPVVADPFSTVPTTIVDDDGVEMLVAARFPDHRLALADGRGTLRRPTVEVRTGTSEGLDAVRTIVDLGGKIVLAWESDSFAESATVVAYDQPGDRTAAATIARALGGETRHEPIPGAADLVVKLGP
jgi:hypothetical protein